LPLEGRHYRLVSFDDLRTGIQYRLSYIGLVGDDGLPADQSHFVAENAFDRCSSLLRAAGMA
jgi:hypothetical protein